MKDYAETTAFLGQWGRFQQVVFFLLCASIMPNGFGTFSMVFLTDVPPHHCIVPEANLTEEWHKASIPIVVVKGKEEQSRCSRYRLDVVRNLSTQGYVPGRDVNLSDLEQEPCVDGWSYSTEIYQSTIVTEFDLVCNDEWKQPFTATTFYTGVLLGSFFSGQLSDKFGRKPVLFATMAVQTVFTFIQVFSTSWIIFIVILFINGLGQISNFVAALVLGAEILTGHVRVMYSSVGTNASFAIGYMMLPLFAYFLRDWKSLLLSLSIPGLAYIPMWWLIPESPRWLLSLGKVEEAESIIRKAAKWNKVQAPQFIFGQYSVNMNDKGSGEPLGVLDLMRTSSVRSTTLNLCLVWFCMFIPYHTLSLNTSQIHTNPYLSCFISALVELPAYVCSWLVLKKFPRRLSVIACLCLGAVPLFLLQLVPEHLSNVTLVGEMLGKFSFTTGTSLMFTYTAELYPTPLRNTATGTCTMVSRLGICIAPFLLKLRVYLKFLPHITLGTLALIAAVVALFVPESFRQPLPETIEHMATRERVHCPCKRRKEPLRTMVPVEDPL